MRLRLCWNISNEESDDELASICEESSVTK